MKAKIFIHVMFHVSIKINLIGQFLCAAHAKELLEPLQLKIILKTLNQ